MHQIWPFCPFLPSWGVLSAYLSFIILETVWLRLGAFDMLIYRKNCTFWGYHPTPKNPSIRPRIALCAQGCSQSTSIVLVSGKHHCHALTYSLGLLGGV